MRSMGASWDREKYAVDRAYLGAERSCVMDGGRSAEGSPRRTWTTQAAPHQHRMRWDRTASFVPRLKNSLLDPTGKRPQPLFGTRAAQFIYSI